VKLDKTTDDSQADPQPGSDARSTGIALNEQLEELG
jgi:hypothetical protein